MINLAQKKQMHVNHDRLLLVASYLLNIGVWGGNFAIWIKVAFGILAGATTIMSFFNTYKTFSKNYRTLWIVVYVNQAVGRIKPQKRRHRKTSISQPKDENPTQ